MINQLGQVGRQEKAVLRHSVNQDINPLTDAEQARQEVEDIRPHEKLADSIILTNPASYSGRFSDNYFEENYVLQRLRDFTRRSLL